MSTRTGVVVAEYEDRVRWALERLRAENADLRAENDRLKRGGV